MEYRRIEMADIEQAETFAIEGLRPHLYSMVLDRSKVRATLEHFIASTQDFHLAAFDGDRIVGGIAAAVYESPWFERAEATVVMFRAVASGVGRELMARLTKWMDDNLLVRRLFMPLEFDASPAMQRLMRCWGFQSTQAVCVRYKG